MDKPEFLKKHPSNFEEQLLEQVVAQLFQLRGIQNATLYVDQIAEEESARRFNVLVRRRLRASGQQPIRKFKHLDSRRNNLLQVADMICGAVFRSYAREDDTFRRIIRAKEESVIEWQ